MGPTNIGLALGGIIRQASRTNYCPLECSALDQLLVCSVLELHEITKSFMCEVVGLLVGLVLHASQRRRTEGQFEELA